MTAVALPLPAHIRRRASRLTGKATWSALAGQRPDRMSAFPRFADSRRTSREVGEVPTAAVSNRSKAVPYSITSSARATSVGGIIQAKCLGGDQIDDQVERDRVAQGAYRRCDRKKTMLVALPCNADQQCKLCSLRSGLASLRVSTGRELLCSDWRYRRQR
jgi:hypothetical protein